MPVPHRSDQEEEALIKARQDIAGRFGFVLGCCSALAAIGINLWWTERSWSWASITLLILFAAFNIPLGIALGLLVERRTREPRDGR